MLTGNAHTNTEKLHEEYGPVVRIMPDALSFNTAQAWKDIYGTRAGKGQLDKYPIIFQRGEAANITSANQADHARIRKLLSHAFSETALREQEPIFNTYFNLLVSKLQDEIDGPAAGKVDIMSWNMFQSVKFLGIMRFAATYPIIDRIFKFLVSSIPCMADKRKSHFEYTRQKTESRLDRQTDRRDFTSYVGQIDISILRYNDERDMTREEIISNAGTLLIAGSETTATLLSGATFHLLANPSTLEKVQAEVRGAFENGKEITLLSVGTPGRLPYMEAVLTESLRVYPPIPASLPRVTGLGGEMIDGNFVPPNTSVGVHQWATYRSSSNFTDSQSFLPERWLADAPERYSHDSKAALQPFSMGPRNCLGR
ncbi:MAG: hypothetical protein Q9191_008181, partial [Dirinaria sp. TL-2023a]